MKTLCSQFCRDLVFFSACLPQTLQNIANKDMATQEIEDDLLKVPQKGQDQLDAFVERGRCHVRREESLSGTNLHRTSI